MFAPVAANLLSLSAMNFPAKSIAFRDFVRFAKIQFLTLDKVEVLPYIDAMKTPQNIRVYDNGGKTCDRYTVVYMGESEAIFEKVGDRWKRNKFFFAVRMNETPFQGRCQYCECLPGKHLGKRIKFKDLPADCQKIVLANLGAVQSFVSR